MASRAPAIGDFARRARDIARQATSGALGTHFSSDSERWPYVSLVLTAYDMSGAPLFLLSDLAEHTTNLRQDPRASLLVEATAGLEDPLTGGRVTLLGSVEKISGDQEIVRFCRRHPSAALYRGFKDFNLYRMSLERGHLVAGFGEIEWLESKDLLLNDRDCAALNQAEEEIVTHMNEDHLDAVNLIAGHQAQSPGSKKEGWIMTGLDPEGADFRNSGSFCRVSFAKIATNAESARVELVRLTKQARTASNTQ